MLRIAIGISTVKKNSSRALELAKDIIILSNQRVSINVVVLSQGEDVDNRTVVENNIELMRSTGLGLSLSRNTLMNNLAGDYLWLLDDDVMVNQSSIDSILKEIEAQDYPDILVGRIECSDSAEKEFYKRYQERQGVVGLLQTSSIELLMKKNFIVKHKLTYNLKLGLGAAYPCGEENYFLIECWNKSARVKFSDKTFVFHPCNEKRMQFLGYFQTEAQVMSKVYLVNILPFRYALLYTLKVILNLLWIKKDFKLTLFFIKNLLNKRWNE